MKESVATSRPGRAERWPPHSRHSAPGSGARIVWGVAALGLIALFCVQALLAIPYLSATTDEPVHLSAGYSYWHTRDFRLNPEHPPLAKLIAALPLLLIKPRLDISSKEWEGSSEYPFAFNFLYSNDADRLLFWGRVPMIALAALGAWITFLWARDLFGPMAGAFAAGLYAFCPNLLAHGMLVTTDVPLATFGLLTLYLFWRQGSQPGWRKGLLTGLALGAAMTSKYSGALFPILVACLAAIRALRQKNRRQALLGEIQNLAVMAAASLLVVEAAYLFSFSPLLYFRNGALVNANHDPSYQSYLLGELKQNGWWYYFVVAFVFKATLPALILLLFATLQTMSGLVDRWGETILLAAIGFYFVVISAGADDLGVRYLLPVFPLIYIWVSRIVPRYWRHRWGRVGLITLLSWQIWAAASSFPNYLPYFNEIAGGPKAGPDLLDDSNVDWGQSLKQAATYVKEKKIGNVVICPFSSFENPGYYGLPSNIRPPGALVSKKPDPGTYVISGHNLAWMKAVDPAWRQYNAVDRIGGMWVYRF